MTPGWILGVIFFAAAVLSLYFLNREAGTRFGLCPFRFVTGFPCFLCGGTTASVQLVSGAPAVAFASNPLVFTALSLFCLWSLLWLVLGIRMESTLPRSQQIVVVIFCVTINWAYLISREGPANKEGVNRKMFPHLPHTPLENGNPGPQRSN